MAEAEGKKDTPSQSEEDIEALLECRSRCLFFLYSLHFKLLPVLVLLLILI